MTKPMLFAGAAAAALTLCACNKQDAAEAAAVPVDTMSEVNSIKVDEAKWNDAYHSKDVDALVANYAPDATFATGGATVKGADAIRKLYTDAVKDPNFDVSFAADTVQVASSGDMAYSRGHFTAKSTDPATKQPVSASGTYVTVYKKQSDGSWKAVEDISVVNPAAAAS